MIFLLLKKRTGENAIFSPVLLILTINLELSESCNSGLIYFKTQTVKLSKNSPIAGLFFGCKIHSGQIIIYRDDLRGKAEFFMPDCRRI